MTETVNRVLDMINNAKRHMAMFEIKNESSPISYILTKVAYDYAYIKEEDNIISLIDEDEAEVFTFNCDDVVVMSNDVLIFNEIDAVITFF